MGLGNYIRKYRNIAGIFLAFLFLGYLGSITFFQHTHIVDGITVVHSHPYKSHNGNAPISHKHSQCQLVLINFLSLLIVTGTALFNGIPLTRKLVHKLIFCGDEVIIPNLCLSGVNRPRAPSAW